MTNAITMTTMLNETFARFDELAADKTRTYPVWACGKAFTIEGVGVVHCCIETAQGATTFMRAHFRRNWKLNGKRIAADQLQRIVGA